MGWPKSLFRLISIESVMLSNHLILCFPSLLPSVFPSISLFPKNPLFASSGQSIRASVSALPNYLGLISLVACNAGDPGLIPGSGRFPWRRKWQSTPALLPGKSHGWRILISYSPWGRKESDRTERLHFHFHFPLGLTDLIL